MSETPIEIPITAVDQLPGKTASPVGRLIDIQNCTTEHYVPSSNVIGAVGGPQRIKTAQRSGCTSLPTTTKDPVTGASSGVAWDNPELLAKSGTQNLSICDSVPRVYNGEDAFVAYSDKRVATNKFTETVFHTSEHTLQISDDAWAQNVCCSVWADTQLVSGVPKIVLYIGFKNDNGAWIIPPKVLYDPSADSIHIAMARVIVDVDLEHFWVIHNVKTGGTNKFRAHVYGLDGAEITTNTAIARAWTVDPGYWDVCQRFGGGMMLIQPSSSNNTSDGISMSAYTLSGATISVTSGSDNAVHCRGPVAWIENDFDTQYYAATIGAGTGPAGKLWGYQFKQPVPSPHTHEFDFEVNPNGGEYPDSLTGYLTRNTNPDNFDNIPDMTVSFSVLSLPAQTVGPAYDPQLRYSQVYSCDFADTVTFIRQNNYTCQVSRAFKHDSDWYVITYYQSGSGQTITGQTLSVNPAGGYMLGQATQSLVVKPGDYTAGAQKTVSIGGSMGVRVTTSLGAQNIDDTGTADKVELVTLSGDPVLPDGMQVAKWTFKNLTNVALTNGGRLHVHASSIVSANDDWQFLYAPSTHVFYTLPVSEFGNPLTPGTFVGSGGGGGTVSMTSMSIYENLSDQIVWLGNVYTNETVRFLAGASVVISGFSAPGNNGTFTVVKANAQTIVPGAVGLGEGIRVVTSTQTGALGPAALEFHPVGEGHWVFSASGMKFSAVLASVAHKLTVDNSTFPINGNLVDNDGEHLITSVATASDLATDGDLFSEVFNTPLIPTISIDLPLDVTPFTFSLPTLALNYQLHNALISVTGAQNDVNNGIYRIVQVNVADSLIYATPADGKTGQVSESFQAPVVITIILSDSIQPVLQPKFFMTPISPGITSAQVGRFLDGTAYADWRIEGDPSLRANMFSGHLAHVVSVSNGKQFVLPYRAKSFTAGEPIVAPTGQIIADAAQTLFESSVGLKRFVINTAPAFPVETTNALTIAGPMTSVFTQSGFTEQGISVAPETPFVVSQAVVGSGTFINPSTTHQYIAFFRAVLENGETVYSPPSAPLDVALTGTNNSNVIGGRLPFPLDTVGKAIAKRYGVTNFLSFAIVLTRTAYRNNTPTIQHFELPDPLNPNAMAPISSTNTSGFAFPDEFTWEYTDANPDVEILEKEILYTDKGFLPRFPAPAAIAGTVWQERQFLVTSDGALVMSGEKTEGDAYWHFPAFRWTFGNDRAVNCKPKGNYLIVGCERSFWYIPSPSSFPDAGGKNGTIPNAVEIEDVTHGCLGPMEEISGGVVYAATVGGAWAINSSFKSVWLSRNYRDDLSLTADQIYSMVVDKRQRLWIVTNTDRAYIYDQVAQAWYKFILPSVNPQFLSLLNGNAAFQDNHRIFFYDESTFVDSIDGDVSAIPWQLSFADFSFAGVRRSRNCLEFQAFGNYKGPHRRLVTLGYPQDDEPDTVFPPQLITSDTPYLYAFNPRREDAATFRLTIGADFEGVDVPGNSAEIECLAGVVILESGLQQTKARM